MDFFEQVVLCRNCEKRMKPIKVVRNGFFLRALKCPACLKRIYHPSDFQEYKKFMEMRNKAFRVKLRMVGNSYAISIPKEIVEFIKEQEKIMNIVKLCFEEAGKLSLIFEEGKEKYKKVKNIK